MKVYKYRNVEKEIFERDLAMVKQNQFFAPKFEMLNDPFEANFNEIVTDTFATLNRAFNINADKLKTQLTEIFDFKTKLGIFSLSKTCFSDQMWAYYASSNKGYCIEYDLERLKDKSQNFDFFCELEVIYSDNIPTIELNDIKSETLHRKMYGCKKEYWKHEQEIRLLFDNSSLKKHHESAITGIYFGCQADESLIESFKMAFRERDIKFYKIKVNKQRHQFESELICKFDKSKKYNIDKYGFEILKYKNNGTFDNYYIYLKDSFTEDSLKEFVLAFREMYCYKPSNLNIFNNSEITALIDAYPLKGEDLVRYAEACVALVAFDDDFIYSYPLKDFYYEEQKAKLKGNAPK